MNINIFLFEFKHFIRNKAKVFSYIIFVIICILSIYNGLKTSDKQFETISDVKKNESLEHKKVYDWIDNISSNEDSLKTFSRSRKRVNSQEPFWAIIYTPNYVVKEPSPMFPFGIGQSQQFGFYKKINRWSSTYDTDTYEEISNYERLINGDIDFSFMIIYLLPLLMIILTFNINGLEKDLNFHKLIAAQNKKVNLWIFNRLLFYVALLLISVDVIIFLTGFFTGALESDLNNIFNLILLSNTYILFFSILFYFAIKNSQSIRSIAFKMISVWILFCVIIPGAVHQYVSYKYPVNYMTDFLDVNRKDTYDIFKLDSAELHSRLIELFPGTEINDKHVNNDLIRRCMSAIANDMNMKAAYMVENQNKSKNELINSTYFFNPISYVQNTWNQITLTDYNSYKKYRDQIQTSIDIRNSLLVLESSKYAKDSVGVNIDTYNSYLELLK